MSIKILSRLRIPGLAMSDAEFEAKKRENEEATEAGYEARHALARRCEIGSDWHNLFSGKEGMGSMVHAMMTALACVNALEKRIRELEGRK